jgi:hypothetical protein
MIIVLVSLTPLASAGAAGTGVSRCAAPDSRTLASNSSVRVFSHRHAGTVTRVYYACLRRTGRKTRLGPRTMPDSFEVPKRFRLAGHVLAYTSVRATLGGPSDSEQRILVHDLARRRVLRRLPAGEIRGAANIDPDGHDGVRDLVVDSKGDVAWIVQNPNALPNPPPGTFTSTRTTEVYAAARKDIPRLLDQGDDIGQTSLARTGCTITWAHASSLRSARLCPAPGASRR